MNYNNNNNSIPCSGRDVITKELLSKILESSGKDCPLIHKFTSKSAFNRGENYLSLVYRVKILLTDKTERHLIIKTLPEVEALKKYLIESGLFHREIDVYEKWLPKMLKFCEKRINDKEIEIIPMWPRSFKSENKNILVLEDLAPQNYKMATRQEQLDLDHSLLVIRTLGRFHAYSLALLKEYPVLREILGEAMFDKRDDRSTQHSRRQFLTVAKIIGSWNGYERFEPIIKKLADHNFDNIRDLLNKGKCRVINHGDCWINNILFKYDENNKPIELKFVDFQICRIASPVFDLLYFFNTSIRHEILLQHQKEIVDEYFKSLESNCKSMGITVPLSLEDIWEEMDEKWEFAFMAASFVLSAVVADPAEAIDMTKHDENSELSLHLIPSLSGKRFGEIFRKKLLYFEAKGYFKKYI